MERKRLEKEKLQAFEELICEKISKVFGNESARSQTESLRACSWEIAAQHLTSRQCWGGVGQAVDWNELRRYRKIDVKVSREEYIAQGIGGLVSRDERRHGRDGQSTIRPRAG